MRLCVTVGVCVSWCVRVCVVEAHSPLVVQFFSGFL